jgi:hypothetical protein
MPVPPPGSPAPARLFTAVPGFLLPALLFLAGPLYGAALEPVTVRSQSGQFLVRGLPRGVPSSGYSTSPIQFVRLDPTITAVSFERVRQAILNELNLPDQWRGLITITLHPVEDDDARVRVNSVHYADGWGYRVDLPERINTDRFIKVAVEVILLEVANRKAVVRESELPPWLVPGLSAALQNTTLSTLVLEPETQVARRDHGTDRMRVSRDLLREYPALKFDQLSMPAGEHLSGDGAALYQACAHLFIHDLLRLRQGRECLRDMLVRLPENLNWQTTFLRAFSAHFPRLIDADKWYAINIANRSGRDAMSVWPLETTWTQLEGTLATQVQVRVDASELPIQTQVKLQRIITEWEFAQQQPVLLQKLNHLQAIRLRAAEPLVGLVEDYLRVLQAYIDGRSSKVAGLFRGRFDPRSVLQQLDELDARRDALRTPPPSTAAAR